MDLLNYTGTGLLGYLVGSIPTGYLMGKARGIDIRQAGSGNIGATNVFRILGKGAGIVVLVLDALKGYVACQFIGFSSEGDSWEPVIGGVSAIVGHNYTCWLRFRGGKGIATSAGVLLGWVPKAFVVVLALWLLMFWASRYVSLASITAALGLPLAVWLTGGTTPMIVVTGLVGVLAIYKHRSNIARLLKGTEHRFAGRARGAASVSKS